jgi:excisionase family DNA binding protein
MVEQVSQRRAYTVQTLAAEWQCSSRQVYSLIQLGSLRSFKIGKRGLRISPEEVQRWVREHEEASTATEARPDGGAPKPSPMSSHMLRALVAR